MEEKDVNKIKEKIVSGVFALTTRTFILQLISFVSTFILTILLTPDIFGIFFLVSAVISFLSYFSDIGLAAALIQKKEEPTRKELVSVFTLQQILIGTTVVIFMVFSDKIALFYKLSGDGLFLLRALLLSFFLSSLKTIPSIILERKLEFSLLVIPQILETLVFYLVAIILAIFHMQAASFAWAALLRGVIGLIAIYLICPWKIGFGFSFSSIKKLITFGIPYQTNSFLALIKDDLMTLFLGKLLPITQIGYIGWAKKWAEAPLRLIMDSIMRVTFPAFSRIQEEKKLLGRAISKSFFFLALLIFPITILMMILINPLIQIIPRYSKWEPAVFAFYLFCISSVFASFSSPSVNALNAIGKIKVTFFLMLMWTVLSWILIPLGVFIYGYNGWALAAVVISLTSFIPIWIIKKYISVAFFGEIVKPLILSMIIGIPGIIFISIFKSIPAITFFVILFLLTYMILTLIFLREYVSPYIPKLINKYLPQK